MKNAFFLFLFFCTAYHATAQPYGQTQYPNGSQLTSGCRTNINARGFLITGMKGTKIHIDKTNDGPLFDYLASDPPIENEYTLHETGGCMFNNIIVTNCVGASAIEIPETPRGEWYALTGAYSSACFLSLLLPDGTPRTTVAYRFPYYSPVIGKPIITASQSGDLFISGQFDTSMYVMRVDTTGFVLWSSFYACGHTGFPGFNLAGGQLDPRAMLESPHNNDLVIAGLVNGNPGANRGNDGFFLTLDPSDGTVITFKSYGDELGTVAPDNYFTAIAPCHSNANGGVGYILGGYTDPYNTFPHVTGHAWLMRVDLVGEPAWNNIYTSSADHTNGEVCGVTERLSNAGVYEYYAVCKTNMSTTDGLIVLKTDVNGMPFSIYHSGVTDEFYYSATTASPLKPIAISSQQGGGIDEGFHIIADNNGNPFLLEAYFNGVTGCDNETRGFILDYEEGPAGVEPAIHQYGSLTSCFNFQLVTPGPASVEPNLHCNNGAVPGGSNISPVVGIASYSNSNGLKVYPNPNNGFFTIEAAEPAELVIYTVLGKKVLAQSLRSGLNSIDLAHEANGVYLISINGKSFQANSRLIKQ